MNIIFTEAEVIAFHSNETETDADTIGAREFVFNVSRRIMSVRIR